MSQSSPVRRPAACAPPRAALQVDVNAMLAAGAPVRAVRLAADLMCHVWWPSGQPFSFALGDLAAALAGTPVQDRWTPWHLRRHRAWAQVFFQRTDDGLWTPHPSYYTVRGGHEP